MTNTAIHETETPSTDTPPTDTPAASVLRSPALWLGIVVGMLELADTEPFDPTGGTTYILPLLALSYLVFALARHGSRRAAVVQLQVAGLIGFTALALLALVVDPALGRYVVAAGWLAHAVWDYAHRDGRVVPTWYVRFCAPVDLMIAVALVIAPWR